MLYTSGNAWTQLGEEYFISEDKSVKQKLSEVRRLLNNHLDKEKVAHALVLAFDLDLNKSFLFQIKQKIKQENFEQESIENNLTAGEEFDIQMLEKIAPSRAQKLSTKHTKGKKSDQGGHGGSSGSGGGSRISSSQGAGI